MKQLTLTVRIRRRRVVYASLIKLWQKITAEVHLSHRILSKESQLYIPRSSPQNYILFNITSIVPHNKLRNPRHFNKLQWYSGRKLAFHVGYINLLAVGRK